MQNQNNKFEFLLEQFADIKIMRFQVPGFNELSLKQKKLIYFLSEAAISGRDIIFDQNYKYNLLIRKSLEAIYNSFEGDRTSESWKHFEVYLKRIWFSNGIHHHYSTDKFYPDLNEQEFRQIFEQSKSAVLPEYDGLDREQLIDKLCSLIFDTNIAAKRVEQSKNKDLVESSAVNFYENVSQEEVEAFYNAQRDDSDKCPISYGLNSKLIKLDGEFKELKYKADGLYGNAIQEMIHWLEKASNVADTREQESYINLLIEYYRTADLRTWDDFSIAWVKDLQSKVDFVHGFIENYGDPLGRKATYESLINFKDEEASKRSQLLSDNAQWFEDQSPIDERFKKEKVEGVSSKVITVAMLAGDCYPATPIGINLPNPDWIRAQHGSKSVTIENITYAYDQASKGNGFLEEFCFSEEEVALENKFGFIADNLHTDMHECLGHGSGKLLEGVSTDVLKNYASPLEEARADLFALYFMLDPKIFELNILPDRKAAEIQYAGYIRNGLLTQLTRIQPCKNLEQAHMRCRKLISEWCYEHGKADHVISIIKRDSKTFVHVSDYDKLRSLFGKLLAEIQRIKSEGDYEAGKEIVEKYGVNVNPELHEEILNRYQKLNLAPYSGFVNPIYDLEIQDDEIVDVKVSYDENFTNGV